MDSNNTPLGEQPSTTESNNPTPQSTTPTNILVILVAIAVLVVTGYFIFSKSNQKKGSTDSQSNTQIALQEKERQTIEICSRTIALPSFIQTSDLQDTGRAEPYPNWWTCQYKTNDNLFSITILDKADTQLSETYQDNFEVLSSLAASSDSNINTEVEKIGITDTISTGIREINLVEKLTENSVGYTGQIFQDFSGSGVYQTATMVDNRYIVFVTYVIMGIEPGDGWRQYFDERWTFEQRNETALFREYFRQVMQEQATIERIAEINQATRKIQ